MGEPCVDFWSPNYAWLTSVAGMGGKFKESLDAEEDVEGKVLQGPGGGSSMSTDWG